MFSFFSATRPLPQVSFQGWVLYDRWCINLFLVSTAGICQAGISSQKHPLILLPCLSYRYTGKQRRLICLKKFISKREIQIQPQKYSTHHLPNYYNYFDGCQGSLQDRRGTIRRHSVDFPFSSYGNSSHMRCEECQELQQPPLLPTEKEQVSKQQLLLLTRIRMLIKGPVVNKFGFCN